MMPFGCRNSRAEMLGTAHLGAWGFGDSDVAAFRSSVALEELVSVSKVAVESRLWLGLWALQSCLRALCVERCGRVEVGPRRLWG